MGNSSDKEVNEQIAQLLSNLQSNDHATQLQVIKVAGEQKISQVVPVLIERLKNIVDPYEPATRQLMETIIWALGEIGDAQAVPVLMDNMRHNAFYKIKANAIIALGEMEVEEAVSPMWEIVQDIYTPEFVRLVTIEALGKIASQEARDYLQELAESLQVPKVIQEKASQTLHYVQGFW